MKKPIAAIVVLVAISVVLSAAQIKVRRCQTPQTGIVLAQTVKISTGATLTVDNVSGGHVVCVAITGTPSTATVSAANGGSGTDLLTQVASTLSTNNSVGGNDMADIWCKANVTGGWTSITVTCASCSGGAKYYFYEFGNAATASATENPGTVINGAACDTDAGTPCVGPSVTNTTSGSVWIVVGGNAGGFSGLESSSTALGWVDDGGVPVTGARSSHRITTASGVNANTLHFTAAGDTYNMSAVAVKPQ